MQWWLRLVCAGSRGTRKSQTESEARAIEGTVGHLNLPIWSLKQGTPIWTGYNIYLKLVSLLVLACLSGNRIGMCRHLVRFWAWRFGGGGYDRCMRGGAYASFRQSSEARRQDKHQEGIRLWCLLLNNGRIIRSERRAGVGDLKITLEGVGCDRYMRIMVGHVQVPDGDLKPVR